MVNMKELCISSDLPAMPYIKLLNSLCQTALFFQLAN